MIFATADLTLNALAAWLAQNDFIATSAVVSELFLRVFPLALAGMAAGYLASPQGFSAAAFAGLTRAIASLAVRYHNTVGWATPGPFNATAMFSWVAGIIIAVAFADGQASGCEPRAV